MGMVSTMNVVSFEEIPVFFSLLVSECCGSRGGAVPSLAWWEREGGSGCEEGARGMYIGSRDMSVSVCI